MDKDWVDKLIYLCVKCAKVYTRKEYLALSNSYPYNCICGGVNWYIVNNNEELLKYKQYLTDKRKEALI